MSTSSSTSRTIPATRDIRPQKGPQERFLSSAADLCIFGGAAGGGKTFALLLETLRHARNPAFGAVVFRRTSPQITNQGGLWDESERLYPAVGATPRVGSAEWVFPSGATVSFRHLQYDADKLAWSGSQVALICFDELTLFEESQFWFLLSRNRSTCGVRPYIRATCNPDADSWVAKLLAWWIDQDTGLPIPERAGRLRWFVRINDALVWADTPEELRAKYPDIPPKSLSFVPAKLSDNPILMAADPGYLANLLALPLVERERLLGGNWKIRPAAGLIFNRGWFDVVDVAPAEAIRVRYWDKAGSDGAGAYSAGVRMSKTSAGVYYVEDVVRGQWSALERNTVVRSTAASDGHDVEVWVEQEPGSGGKESAEISVRELAGYVIRVERVTGDKVSRAGPFSAQAEARNVRLVRNPVRDWIPAFLDELHGFPLGKYLDQADAASGAFNKLAAKSALPWVYNPPESSRSLIETAPAGVWLPDVDVHGFQEE